MHRTTLSALRRPSRSRRPAAAPAAGQAPTTVPSLDIRRAYAFVDHYAPGNKPYAGRSLQDRGRAHVTLRKKRAGDRSGKRSAAERRRHAKPTNLGQWGAL